MTPHDQVDLLMEGCEHVETRAELLERITAKKSLVVKFGVDPTGSELHLGHAVVLHKLRQFQDLGHTAILLIGDFTAKIGDPTGRNEQRPALGDEQIAANMAGYIDQAQKILNLETLVVRHNSEWLAPLTFADINRLLAQTTVAQMLTRNDFDKRYSSGQPISLQEFMYPVAVAYDSVALRSDVELGGKEQLFNLLIGRPYQMQAGQPPQICMTLPILEGLDGVARMGKSLGNYVGLTEPPEVQFGKLMSLPDALVPRYAQLAAFERSAEVERLRADLESGRLHPMDAKKHLASTIVARYHGAAGAQAAREHFERTVQRKEAPAAMPQMQLGGLRRVADVLVAAKFAESKRAAERLISGGGVRIDGEAVRDAAAPWTSEAPAVLSVGTRKFVKVLP